MCVPTDIDECDENLDSCHDQASCTDGEGSYNCTCNTGYEGDGFNCTSAIILLYHSTNYYYIFLMPLHRY